MIKYRSKIGAGLAIFLSIVIGGTTFLMAYQKVWLGFFINVLLIIIVGYFFLSVHYLIYGGILKVKSGFIVHKSIDIQTIQHISETNNPISAPASSLDRLEISYGLPNNLKSVLISPKDKTGFIDHLQKINPNIEIR